MTNAELAESLNAAVGLTGRGAVTPNVIRQWIGWKVLPMATATGQSRGKPPIWTRDDRTHRRAKKLAEWRKTGVRRETSVIVQTYIECGYSDFERFRKSLLSEFRRARAQLMRKVTTDTNFSNLPELRGTQKAALRRQGGPLDERFRETNFEQSADFYVGSLSLTLGNQAMENAMQPLMAQAATQMFPALPTAFLDIIMSKFISGLSGIFGAPDEIECSGEQVIQQASERQFRIARATINKVFKFIRSQETAKKYLGNNTDVANASAILFDISPEITVRQWAAAWLVLILGMGDNFRSFEPNLDDLNAEQMKELTDYLNRNFSENML